ncbi:hypothetical protein JW964_18165 [candidate division KSB1 bacterium]|nr:hypothetical protein [candidate division KSB1 bacterium]
MKTFIVVSAIGKDRPGLVNRISHEIKLKGGNIEVQRSVKMADEFALILLVSLEKNAENVESLIQGLTGLKTENFFIYARKAMGATAEIPSRAQYAILLAEGVDQIGIIDEITLLLLENNINIDAMDYDVSHAPMTGMELFQMEAKIVIPPTINITELKTKLKEMENRLNIDILFRYPIEK